jgi:hypothetical protein
VKYLVLDVLGNVRIVGNDILFEVGEKVCGKKLLKVTSIVSSAAEVGDRELMHFLRAFYNSLNLGFPVEVRSIVTPLNKEKILNEINRKLENLSIILEVNPSNMKVRTELERLKRIRNKIVKLGIMPYDIVAFFVVEACGSNIDDVRNSLRNRAFTLKNTLESLGIHVTEVKGIEGRYLLKLFFRGSCGGGNNFLRKIFGLGKGIRVVTLRAASLMPFIIKAKTPLGLRSSGIYLGKHAITGEDIFWNIRSGFNPHVLVIGPSGSGKTEFLATLGGRLWISYGTKVFIVDVKGEYEERLRGKGLDPALGVLGEDLGLGLTALLKELPRPIRAGYLTDILVDSFALISDKDIVSSLYSSIDYALRDSLSDDWIKRAIDYAESFSDGYVSYRVTKILKFLMPLEEGIPLIEFLLKDNPLAVLNLSKAAKLGVEALKLAADVVSKVIEVTLLRKPLLDPAIPKFGLIFDEGWQFMGEESVVLKLIKMGRGYGALVAVATQGIEDMKGSHSEYIENSGLIVAMASPDKEYWSKLSPFMKISESDIDELTVILGRGEGLIRIMPDPRPIPVKFDNTV